MGSRCLEVMGTNKNRAHEGDTVPVLPLFSSFSSLRTADVSPRSSPLRNVSQGGTSATQRQKFHTDDVNQSLHNKSSSHGVPNANLFNFTFLLVDFGEGLCSSIQYNDFI